jgi:hypothetical protein
MMQPKRMPIAAALLALFAASTAAAQAGPVVLDGAFEEWEGTRAFDDPADARAPYADVRSVKVRYDADAVYFALELERPLALQGMAGTLSLLLDEDADSSTGWNVHGMRGVDAAIEFSAALGRGGERMGIGLRLMHREGRASCVGTANVAGVASAPSHASRRHEVRIPRGEFISFGGRMAARLVSVDSADRVVDSTDVVTVDLADARPRPTPPGHGAADPLARAPGTDFRVVSWNVGREDLFRQPEAFGALLRPLAPDLLLLDEVAGGRSAEEVEALLDRIFPGDRPWRAVYGVSGGSQRGVIATRGTAPRMVAPFDRELPHPDSARALAPAGDPWLQDRLRSKVPATGAVVEVGGRRLLAVTVDLEAAGTPGSTRDRLRRMEALVIRDALGAAAREGGMDGVLVAGDLNLVGSRDPLDILSAGPDVDGSALGVPLPLRLDGCRRPPGKTTASPSRPGGWTSCSSATPHWRTRADSSFARRTCRRRGGCGTGWRRMRHR